MEDSSQVIILFSTSFIPNGKVKGVEEFSTIGDCDIKIIMILKINNDIRSTDIIIDNNVLFSGNRLNNCSLFMRGNEIRSIPNNTFQVPNRWSWIL